ncbi:MAG: DUF1653 domain-containing protein [Oscillospiraceae bacterium]|nr:DUF1653 domain-containing protein [Oscillospiraceae bacterium]
MADRRIYAGYYRRYDGKMIYVVTMARDADTDENVIIWTPNVYSDKRAYYTMSRRSFCGCVFVDGVRQPKFKRQTQMRITASENFEDRFVKGMSIRKYAQAYGLNRGSMDHLQQKFFAALAQALRERDEADGRSRLQVKYVHRNVKHPSEMAGAFYVKIMSKFSELGYKSRGALFAARA